MAFDLESSMQRALADISAHPSKRSNRNKSGRAGRKQWNGQQWLLRAGGVAGVDAAIYSEKTEMCHISDNPKTGLLPDGTPRRDPRPSREFYHFGRSTQ